MWPLLAIVLGALGLLYAWWPLRRAADAPPLPDEGAAVGDPSIAEEAFETGRRWSVAAGEIRSAPVGPLDRTDAPSAGRAVADQGDEEGS